ACVTWYVSSDEEFAQIDPQAGVLKVSENIRNGYSFIVAANVESGRKILSIPVYIYTPESNPLVGTWIEKKRYSCKSGNEILDAEHIGELIFRADGTMYVTRAPFELYVDYWGRYILDRERRNIGFVIDGGNRVPFDVDGFGRFSIKDDGGLILYRLS